MQYEVSGFWRRCGAFFLDALIMGVVGLILGLFFSKLFVELAGWGRGVGFIIAAIYFVIFNSRLGDGQTIGKRFLKIQVVDENGALLNVFKSTVRYCIIGIPYFLNGAMIPESFCYPIGFVLLSLLVFGFGLSIIYLIIFNRKTRQSLHDIITRTYVVQKNIEASQRRKPIWVVHYAVCGVFLLLSLLVPIFIGHLSRNEFFAELTKTREQIQSIPHVIYATIQDGRSTFRQSGSESKITTYLSTRVLIENKNTEDEKFASRIANTILQTHKEAMKRDRIQVILTHGYDIGIFSYWKNNRYSFPPKHWIKLKE